MQQDDGIACASDATENFCVTNLNDSGLKSGEEIIEGGHWSFLPVSVS